MDEELEKLNALIRKARSLGMNIRISAWNHEPSKTDKIRRLKWNPVERGGFEYDEVPDDAGCTMSIGLNFRHIYKGDIESYILARSFIQGAAENIGRLQK